MPKGEKTFGDRMIRGEQYHLIQTAEPRNISECKKEADDIRRKGFPTIIIKSKKGCRVYSRYTYRR